jgi:sugar diacid utilization regulator/GAF domain-containing protein
MSTALHAVSGDQTADPIDVDPYRAAVSAFCDMAADLADVSDLGAVLSRVARTACDLIGVEQCRILLRDEATGRVTARASNTDRSSWAVDETLGRILAKSGSPTSSRALLAARVPVLLRAGPRGPELIKDDVLRIDAHALLVVPILHAGLPIALLLLADRGRPQIFGPTKQRTLAVFAELSAGVLQKQRAVEELRAELKTASQRNHVLAHSRHIESLLNRQLLSGAGLQEFATVVGDATEKSCAIYDESGRRHALYIPPTEAAGPAPTALFEATHRDHPDIRRALASLGKDEIRCIGPLPAAALPGRYLIARIDVGNEAWGYAALVETGAATLSALDEVALASAARHATLKLTVQQETVTSVLQARAALLPELINGDRNVDELRQRARYLNVKLDIPQIACVVESAGGDDLAAEPLLAAIQQRLPAAQVLGGGALGGVVALVEVDGEVPALEAVTSLKQHFTELCRHNAGEHGLIVGLSTVCRAAPTLPRVLREARKVVGCARLYSRAGWSCVIAADDLGPARLLLDHGAVSEAERFVHDVLGELLDDSETNRELLRTLHALFEGDRSVRRAAQLLNVHENTIRYRLSRVQTLTGLDIARAANDQMTAQLAVLMLRLKGHAGLPAFAEPVAGNAREDLTACVGSTSDVWRTRLPGQENNEGL